MDDRSLIATGGIATVLAAICCATPILAIFLGAIGLTAWIAQTDYLVMLVLLLGLGLVALYRRSCATTAPKPRDLK